MSKSDIRRDLILDRLADYVLAEGLKASSLRALAKAADTSDRMLLYYFKDKAELMQATLGRISERLTVVLSAQAGPEPLPLSTLRAKLADLVLADELWPYMCLWLEVAGLSARKDPLYGPVGEAMGRGFLAWGAAQLDSPTPEARDADAAALLVTMEGAMLLKSIGMEDVSRKALED